MAEYGFTSSDISSLNQARAGLSAGFMQLGKQIEEDMTRIATIREMKAFGAELANLDPTNDAFPQQLLGTMSKYPMAIQTPLAKQGIEVLGNRYQTAQQAKQATALFSDIGGGTMLNPKTGVAYRKDESGIPQFIDTTPNASNPVRGTMVSTAEGQLLIDPTSGKTIQQFAPRPQSTRSTNLNVLPQDIKIQISDIDTKTKSVLTERQKLIDAINNRKISEDERPKAYEDLKNLEANLESLSRNKAQILQNFRAESPLPTGARQGINGASLMPTPQSGSSFVPMALPSNIAPAPVTLTPRDIPAPSQMTLNTEDSSVLPENLPVLPTPRRTAAEVKAPRLYRKVGNEIKYLGNDLLKAVQQARDDDMITDEEGRRVLEASGLFRRR